MDDNYRRRTPIFHEMLAIVLTRNLISSGVPGWDSGSHIQMVLTVQKAFLSRFAAARIANHKPLGNLDEPVPGRMATA